MQMMIESTGKITSIDGVPVRVWKGVTAGGVACFLFIHRIAVATDADSSEFEAELAAQAHPGNEVSLNLILKGLRP